MFVVMNILRCKVHISAMGRSEVQTRSIVFVFVFVCVCVREYARVCTIVSYLTLKFYTYNVRVEEVRLRKKERKEYKEAMMQCQYY